MLAQHPMQTLPTTKQKRRPHQNHHILTKIKTTKRMRPIRQSKVMTKRIGMSDSPTCNQLEETTLSDTSIEICAIIHCRPLFWSLDSCNFPLSEEY
mmetsp:Transcript_11841/g.25039  ORF Transcript_11841/g.25039 Transcript_11841/m.25039 type:complete len:96 (-) Transcript_11841:28-315(-)